MHKHILLKKDYIACMKRFILFIISIAVIGSLFVAYVNASSNRVLTNDELGRELENTISLAGKSIILLNKFLNGSITEYNLDSEFANISTDLTKMINDVSKSELEDFEKTDKILDINNDVLINIKRINADNPELKNIKVNLENLIISADSLR